ncbi:MAG: hypothetical protein JRI58_14495 [Deltaproteobacteria bacterium]|nr:hypothetical protein [Deltaproteobacteria bacterium]
MRKMLVLSSFLVGMAVAFLVARPSAAEINYAQSILHEIGNWTNVGGLLGAPDGNFANTANTDAATNGMVSAGAAVWLDFGRVIQGGTIVIYHDDPGGNRTSLFVGVHASCSGMPSSPPAATDAGSREFNIQGTGTATCYFVSRDFRYVRLDHFNGSTDFQDGIDAVAVIDGNPALRGVYLDPHPPLSPTPIYPAAQQNNGYWSNPANILEQPDALYAWSANNTQVMPRMVVDLGRVVTAGQITLYHDKPYPDQTSLNIYVNAEEYDPDPDTSPDMAGADGWMELTGAHWSSGTATLQFPPTRFRYILLAQSQCSPGQQDGVDAIEVYEVEGNSPGDMIYAYEGDVLPGSDGWTPYPAGTNEPSFSTIEQGSLLHMDVPASTTFYYMRDIQSVPEKRIVLEIDLQIVSGDSFHFTIHENDYYAQFWLEPGKVKQTRTVDLILSIAKYAMEPVRMGVTILMGFRRCQDESLRGN